MMGITNHWVSFLAHKYNDKVEFWFFNSTNEDSLELTEQEIQDYVL